MFSNRLEPLMILIELNRTNESSIFTYTKKKFQTIKKRLRNLKSKVLIQHSPKLSGFKFQCFKVPISFTRDYCCIHAWRRFDMLQQQQPNLITDSFFKWTFKTKRDKTKKTCNNQCAYSENRLLPEMHLFLSSELLGRFCHKVYIETYDIVVVVVLLCHCFIVYRT